MNNLSINPSQPNIRLGRWTLTKELGTGATSRVFLATEGPLGKPVAVKIFTPKKSISSELLRSESLILSGLDHPHIVKYIESIESARLYDSTKGCNKTVAAVVMEFVSRGELFGLLKKNVYLSEVKARRYFNQIINAVDHMHKQDVVHRDLKLDNILIDEDDNLRVVDFGYATSTLRTKEFTHPVGTQIYFPPEIHEGRIYSGEQADLFATGVILFCMVTGHMPFVQADQHDRYYLHFYKKDMQSFWQLHERKMNKKLANQSHSAASEEEFKFDQSFKDLISKMLAVEPSERLTADAIMKHSWVTKEMKQEGGQIPPHEEVVITIS